MKITVKRIDPAFPTRVAFLVGVITSLLGIIIGFFAELAVKPEERILELTFVLGVLSSILLYPLGTYITIRLLNLLLKKKGLELDVEKIEESPVGE